VSSRLLLPGTARWAASSGKAQLKRLVSKRLGGLGRGTAGPKLKRANKATKAEST